MDIYVIGLRIIHITAGVFWAGTAFFTALILEPAIRTSGPEGQKTMGTIQRLGFVALSSVTSGLTILSGLLLYGNVSSGFQISWITSPAGLTLSLGALCGIAGSAVGGLVGRTGSDLSKLGAAVAQSGGKPTPEQGTQMAALGGRLTMGAQINAVLLLIAVLCMAVGPELMAR